MIDVDITTFSAEINRFYATNLENIQLEIVELPNDVALKVINMDKEFRKLVEARKYRILKNWALKLKSFFISTYLSEATFWLMPFIKNKFRSRLTDENLNDSLRVAVSNYCPYFEKLCQEIQSQPSH